MIDREMVDECKSIDPQCILVLGCAVWADNKPSPMLKDRLDTAIFWKTEKSYKEVCEYLYSRGLIPEKITERKSSLEEIYLDTVKEKNN